MPTSFFQDLRTCEECGEKLWGSATQMFCSKECRQRSFRARKAWHNGHVDLVQVCAMIAGKRDVLSSHPGKLLPRLFRMTAVELRKRGWDPIELLMSIPDDPVHDEGEGEPVTTKDGTTRRRWHHPPEVEIEKLEARILERKKRGDGTEWYEKRRAQLVRYLEQRDGKRPSPRAPS